jgi:hypothetical protein
LINADDPQGVNAVRCGQRRDNFLSAVADIMLGEQATRKEFVVQPDQYLTR